jgi:NitT/TauT family transport system substrate-binding protein
MVPIGEAGATAYEAVRSKRVVAYASNVAELLTLKSRGLTFKDLTPDEFKNLPAQSLVATPDSLSKNRDALAVVGRGIAKATLFCQTNKDACHAVMRKVAPEHYTNPDVANGQMDVALDLTKIGPGNLWGAHSPKEMQDYIKLTLDSNPSFKPFEAKDVLVDDLIPAVNQFDKDAVIKKAKEYKP